MFETTVAVVGSVVTEPRMRETSGGDRVASFRVLSTARRFDRQAQRWVDGDRFFATVNCWRHLADGVARDVQKRNSVVVSGRLRTREYESGGQWRSVVEIEANAVGLDLGRRAREDAAVGTGSAPAVPEETGPAVGRPHATGPEVTEADAARPEQAGPEQAGPDIAGSRVAKADVVRADMAGSAVTGPDKAAPNKAGPDKTGPAKAGQDETGQDETDPDKTDLQRPGAAPATGPPGSRAEVVAGCASVPSG